MKLVLPSDLDLSCIVEKSNKREVPLEPKAQGFKIQLRPEDLCSLLNLFVTNWGSSSFYYVMDLGMHFVRTEY